MGFIHMLTLLNKISKGELTTPPTIDQDVSSFCVYLRSSQLPIYIPVQPYSWSRVNCCDLNVRKAVNESGGVPVFGFRIWSIPKLYIEADLHCIWQKSDGMLVDITPNIDGENRTLFLPEPKLKTVRLRFKGDKPRLALHPSLQAAVAMMTEREKRIACLYPPDKVLWDTSLSYKRLKKK